MDRTRRDLERVVAAEHDDNDARHRLTVSMARSTTGIVAFWSGTERPHPSAMKTAIGFDVPTQDGTVRPETLGWILAVTSAADILEIAALRGGCRLIDLATWRIVGLFGQAESVSPRKVLKIRPEKSISADSLHARQISPVDIREPQVDDNGDFVLDGIRMMSGVSESLYDREIFMVRGTVCHYGFFQNTRSFCEHAMGSKFFGADTNLIGNGGSLPHASFMIVNGISMLLDARSYGEPRENVDQKILNAICANSRVSLVLRSNSHHELPSRLVFPRERGVGLSVDPQPSDVVRLTGTAPAVYPFAAPFVLRHTFSFAVMLAFQERAPLQDVLQEAKINHLGIMCVLHGTRFEPRRS